MAKKEKMSMLQRAMKVAGGRTERHKLLDLLVEERARRLFAEHQCPRGADQWPDPKVQRDEERVREWRAEALRTLVRDGVRLF